jgi:hypothetical protein
MVLTGTCEPITKLNEILTISAEPIPSHDIPDDLTGSHKKYRLWTAYEDSRLIAGVFRFGVDNWSSISKFVGNDRTRAQCCQRWQRGLDPHLCKSTWSVSEDRALLELVQCFGVKNWTLIAVKMGNRSDVQCRYHYMQMEKAFSVRGQSNFGLRPRMVMPAQPLFYAGNQFPQAIVPAPPPAQTPRNRHLGSDKRATPPAVEVSHKIETVAEYIIDG